MTQPDDFTRARSFASDAQPGGHFGRPFPLQLSQELILCRFLPFWSVWNITIIYDSRRSEARWITTAAGSPPLRGETRCFVGDARDKTASPVVPATINWLILGPFNNSCHKL